MNPNVARWSALIVDSARRHALPPSLVAGLVDTESGGNPDAVSHAGAVGLGQVMPGEHIPGRPSAVELRDPATNLEWTCGILADARAWTHTQAGALAAYYGAVDADGHPTTATDGSGVDGWAYVRLVEAAALRYAELDCYADADARQYAPLGGSWREAWLNVRGVADDALSAGRALRNELAAIGVQASAAVESWQNR